MNKVLSKQELLLKLEKEILEARGRWSQAVAQDAYDLIEKSEHEYFITDGLMEDLLCGASDWRDYSYGGCAYCYNSDIASHYCTPSELKRTKNGMLKPNKMENWLDVQARALYQAYMLILEVLRRG